jgi:hypothetical protein
MGHGGRERYGYSRETTDETYVVSELSKLWNATTPVTTEELLARDDKMAKVSEIARTYLEARIRELERSHASYIEFVEKGNSPEAYLKGGPYGVTTNITMKQDHEDKMKELAKLKEQLALLD